MIKAAAKSILANFHLLDPARRLRRRIKRPFKLSDRAIGARYLAESDTPKLHIGCGDHVLSGWLNTDYEPELPIVMHLDASQRFPFKEATFDYIFSEHVIEHISYWDGMKTLAECFRVLKGSGKVRISTPDLAFLVDLTKPDKSELQRAYVKWAVVKSLIGGRLLSPSAFDDEPLDFRSSKFLGDSGPSRSASSDARIGFDRTGILQLFQINELLAKGGRLKCGGGEERA